MRRTRTGKRIVAVVVVVFVVVVNVVVNVVLFVAIVPFCPYFLPSLSF